jgi:hypothetical protein
MTDKLELEREDRTLLLGGDEDKVLRLRILESHFDDGPQKMRVVKVLLVGPVDGPLHHKQIAEELVNAAQDLYQRHMDDFHPTEGFEQKLLTVAVKQGKKK